MKQRRLLWMSLAAASLLLLVGAVSAVGAQNQPAGTVNVPTANLRSGPGTGFPVVGQASFGTTFDLLATNTGRDWYQLCCLNGQTGWMWGDLLTIEGSTANLPVIAAPVPLPTPTPAATAVPPSSQYWRGEYFNNRTLQGAPALVRNDPEVNFRWGGASPGPGVAGTNFSVRWVRTPNFNDGTYTFYATVDDGVRLWLDGILLIDDWRESSARTVSATFQNLGAGTHTIRVEYFQAGGDSIAVVRWDQQGQYPDWKGEYFNDINLQRPPLLVRNDASVNFNWGLGSPDPAVPVDNFSVRWTRRAHFAPGDYAFFARTSDGVKVYLDGWNVIDEWHDTEGYPTYTGIIRGVGEGDHTLTVEYYERGGIAYAEVWWQKNAGGGPLP